MTTLDLIRAALAEDIGAGDITTHATVPDTVQATAHLLAKQAGIACGIDIAAQVFTALDPTLHCAARCCDSTAFEVGATLLTVTGSARSLLTAERTALNFAQRLCGIATHTARYVAELAGTSAKLLDTRKTIPGWRALEKYAVQCGGGVNHRQGLFDRYLVKNNHADLAGGLDAALQHIATQRDSQILLEVEVRNAAELDIALAHRADIILLDNFSVEDTAIAVHSIRKSGLLQLPTIESSGGITLANIHAYAAVGVDCISVGALTHSASALDLHLRITAI